MGGKEVYEIIKKIYEILKKTKVCLKINSCNNIQMTQIKKLKYAQMKY